MLMPSLPAPGHLGFLRTTRVPMTTLGCDDGNMVRGVLKHAAPHDQYMRLVFEGGLVCLAPLQHDGHIGRLLAWAPLLCGKHVRLCAVLLRYNGACIVFITPVPVVGSDVQERGAGGQRRQQ